MFNTILVALDNPELSAHIMRAIAQIKLQPETTVILTHVISPVESGLEQPADRPYIDPKLGLFRHTEKQLQIYQAQLPCQSELEIVTGDPAEEIIRLANIYKAQLIVMGSRGLTGVNRILKGSVSSQVFTDASCSVMIVKPS